LRSDNLPFLIISCRLSLNPFIDNIFGMTEMTERFWRFVTGKIGLYLPTLIMLSNIFFRPEKPVMTQMTQMTAFSDKTSAGKKLVTWIFFFYLRRVSKTCVIASFASL